jgi:hypothetical protein
MSALMVLATQGVFAASTGQQQSASKSAGGLVGGPTFTLQSSLPAKPATTWYRGTLRAVYNDSVIVERDIDPVTARMWAQSGLIPERLTSYAAITTMAIVEDRVLERIYFDTGTLDTPEEMKAFLHQPVRVHVRFDRSGLRYAIRVKG